MEQDSHVDKTRDESEVLDERKKLDLEIAKLESQVARRKNNFKIGIWLISGLAIFLGGFLYYALPIDSGFLGGKEGSVFIAVAYGGIFVILYYYMSQSRIASIQSEVDLLKSRKRILYQLEPTMDKPGNAPSLSYFDSLVRINVENLAEYYNLVKIHTNNSFRVSVVISIIGFVFILVGLAIGFFAASSSMQTISYISTGAGIVVEFIAGVFFYLYNKTVIQLKEYHDSLLAVQNILLSFKIVGDTRDEKEKSKMVSQMIVFLIGKQSSSVSLPNTKSENLNK